MVYQASTKFDLKNLNFQYHALRNPNILCDCFLIIYVRKVAFPSIRTPDRRILENSRRLAVKDLYIGNIIKAKAEFYVELIIGDNKLTRLYTGFPTYDAFKALAEYLEPKVVKQRK